MAAGAAARLLPLQLRAALNHGPLAPCLQGVHEELERGHASLELQECREQLQLLQERAAVAASNAAGGCGLEAGMLSETRLRIAELAEENEALQARCGLRLLAVHTVQLCWLRAGWPGCEGALHCAALQRSAPHLPGGMIHQCSPPLPPLACRLQQAQGSCPAAPTCEEGQAGQVSRVADTTPRATRRAELLQGQVSAPCQSGSSGSSGSSSNSSPGLG